MYEQQQFIGWFTNLWRISACQLLQHLRVQESDDGRRRLAEKRGPSNVGRVPPAAPSGLEHCLQLSPPDFGSTAQETVTKPRCLTVLGHIDQWALTKSALVTRAPNFSWSSLKILRRHFASLTISNWMSPLMLFCGVSILPPILSS